MRNADLPHTEDLLLNKTWEYNTLPTYKVENPRLFFLIQICVTKKWWICVLLNVFLVIYHINSNYKVIELIILQ